MAQKANHKGRAGAERRFPGPELISGEGQEGVTATNNGGVG